MQERLLFTTRVPRDCVRTYWFELRTATNGDSTLFSILLRLLLLLLLCFLLHIIFISCTSIALYSFSLRDRCVNIQNHNTTLISFVGTLINYRVKGNTHTHTHTNRGQQRSTNTYETCIRNVCLLHHIFIRHEREEQQQQQKTEQIFHEVVFFFSCFVLFLCDMLRYVVSFRIFD